MSTPMELVCPLCGGPAPETPSQCPSCGIPLAGYWRVLFRPWRAYNQALGLAAADKLDAATRAAAAAVALEPGHAGLRLLLARLLARLGEIDEAITHAEAAFDARPDADEPRRLVEELYRLQFQRDPCETPDPAPPSTDG